MASGSKPVAMDTSESKEKRAWTHINMGCLCPVEKKAKAGTKHKHGDATKLLPCGVTLKTDEMREVNAGQNFGIASL